MSMNSFTRIRLINFGGTELKPGRSNKPSAAPDSTVVGVMIGQLGRTKARRPIPRPRPWRMREEGATILQENRVSLLIPEWYWETLPALDSDQAPLTRDRAQRHLPCANEPASRAPMPTSYVHQPLGARPVRVRIPATRCHTQWGVWACALPTTC